MATATETESTSPCSGGLSNGAYSSASIPQQTIWSAATETNEISWDSLSVDNISVGTLLKMSSGLYHAAVDIAKEKVYQPAVSKVNTTYTNRVYAPAVNIYNTAVNAANEKVYAPAVGIYNTAVKTAANSTLGMYNSAIYTANARVVEPAVVHAVAVYEAALPTVITLLDRVQPFVHSAVGVSTPYITKAMTVAKPTFDRAVERARSLPIVTRAVEVSIPYAKHPLVQQTLATSVLVAEAVRQYCDPVAPAVDEPLYAAPSSSSISSAPLCPRALEPEVVTVGSDESFAAITITTPEAADVKVIAAIEETAAIAVPVVAAVVPESEVIEKPPQSLKMPGKKGKKPSVDSTANAAVEHDLVE